MVITQLLVPRTKVPAMWAYVFNSGLSGLTRTKRLLTLTTANSNSDASRHRHAIVRFSIFLLMSTAMILSLMLVPAGSIQRETEKSKITAIELNQQDNPIIDFVIIASKKNQSDFIDKLFGNPPSTKSQEKVPDTPKNTERKKPKIDQPKSEGAGGLDYSNLESIDLGFSIEGAPSAAFSVDIPYYWKRINNGLSNQLIFISPDSDPDAQMSLAITGEPANGRTDQDFAIAHATELQDIGDAKIIEQGPVKTAAGPGWRVLLKVTSPSDMDILLVDEMVVIRSGPVLYKLELTAPEPIWHVAQQIMKQALGTLYIAQ